MLSDNTNTGLSKYENVQLLRGPDALFSGNGQPSGSINLVRKRPTQDFQLKTTLSAGSWNNYLGEIDISSPLNADGNIRGRAVASYNDTEKFYENSHRKYTTLYGILEANILDNTILSTGISYDKSDGSGLDSAPQYPRYSSGALLPVSRKMGRLKDDISENESTNFFINLKHQFNEQWQSKLNSSYTTSKNSKRNGYYYGAADPLTNQGSSIFSTYAFDLSSDAFSIDFNVQGDIDIFGHNNKLIIGADYIKTETEYEGKYVNLCYEKTCVDHPVMPINWNNFDLTKVKLITRESIANNTQADVTQYGAYLYNSFSIIDPLKLIIGGRLASYKYDNVVNNDKTTQNNKNIFTPYYALQYDFLPDWTAYLTRSEGFEDQSNRYSENGKALDPTTSMSYELGIKGNHLDGVLNSSIAIYQTKRKNFAVQLFNDKAFSDENPGKSCCYVGDGQFKGKGIEFDLSGAVLPNLSLNLGYTYDDSVTDYGAEKGKRLSSQSPEHILRLWGRYQFTGALENLTVGSGVKTFSDYYAEGTVKAWNPNGGKDGNGAFDGADIDYKFNQKGYTLWDAFIQYQVTPQWTASFNINNILNKKYLQNVGSTAFGNMYGEPRNVLFTLRGTF